ncbi:uncharacterized protein LOC118974651 [Sturnira hondurensis]|uniref:uncharacterized protein LOC118974651 n=1 Tax=Sturnira hondurensis TaxID=192404 RepID=UPI0018792C6C|nr:uncharacterized protein LOC118974651 [Sturnira hondurensis]
MSTRVQGDSCSEPLVAALVKTHKRKRETPYPWSPIHAAAWVDIRKPRTHLDRTKAGDSAVATQTTTDGPWNAPSVSEVIGNTGVRTLCPGIGSCPRSRRRAGPVQPSRCGRCSQSPLLPDCHPPAPAPPKSHLVSSAPPCLGRWATYLQSPPGSKPLSSDDSLRFGVWSEPPYRAGIARLVPASAQDPLLRWAGGGATPRRRGLLWGGVWERQAAQRASHATWWPGSVCEILLQSGYPPSTAHSFREVTLSSEPSCPRKELALTGGRPRLEGCQYQPPATPRNNVRFQQGSGSAVLAPAGEADHQPGDLINT